MKTRTKVLLKAAENIDRIREGSYFWVPIGYAANDFCLNAFDRVNLDDWMADYSPRAFSPAHESVEDRVMFLCLLAAVSETEE